MNDVCIGARIKKARESLGFKQGDVAKATGVSKQAISNYESGIRTPKIETLDKISICLKVSLDYLAKGEGYVNEEAPSVTVAQWDHKNIPILGKIAAGKPLFVIENIEAYFPNDEMLNGEFFFLKVVGESMRDLRIYDGDLVLIKRQNSADNGQIVVALVHGYETTLKTYRETKDGIWLLPANAGYKALFFSNTELEENPDIFQIEGVATKLLANIG